MLIIYPAELLNNWFG